MKIIGFGIKRLSGERNQVKPSNLTLSQNIEVKEVTKEKLEIGSDEAINVHFVFSINYSENYGKVEIEGSVIIIPDKEEAKDFNKELKAKAIPERFRTQLFNFIIAKCNIKALALEDDVNLPYHVPMPKIGNPPEN